MKLRSNEARLIEAGEAYREVSNNWMMPSGSYCDVVRGTVSIYGDATLNEDGVPVVYWIPAALSYKMVYPGHPGLVPCALPLLMTTLIPLIAEPFTVELYDGENVHNRWHIRPGKCNVLQATLAPAGVRMMSWAATGAPQFSLGIKKGRATGFTVRVNKTRSVQLHSTYNGVKVLELKLSPDDALKLGLALVQAAAGCTDKNVLNSAVEEHRFLLSESVVPSGNDKATQEGLSDA